MPDPNLFRLNRVPYSWTSCAHFFNGLPYKGITASTFKETKEMEIVHAAQQDGTPLGITSGIYKVEGVSFTMLRDSATALMADLSIFGLGSYGDAEFTYICQLFEPVAGIGLPGTPALPSIPSNVIITGCKISGVEEKQEKGSGALVTEFSCMAMYVIRSYGGAPLQLWSALRTLLP